MTIADPGAERADLGRPSDPVPWQAIFDNTRPVEVEIGCGHGRFLVDAARRAPHRNFFGMERRPRLAACTSATIAAAGLANARVLCCDARCVLSRIIAPASVSAYHLYFPDPWWKRRHHKRRIHGGDFGAAIARTIMPDGRVYVATDVGPLMLTLSERFAAAGLERLPFPGTDPSTTVARRCGDAGRQVHRAVFACATG